MHFVTTSSVRRANHKAINTTRTLVKDSMRSFWAMADQGLVSLGNFGVNIVLARYFAHQDDLAAYGAFWVLMELMFFLNGVHNALVIYPLTIRGAVLDAVGLGRMTTQSLALTACGGPLMLLALVFTAMVAHLSVSAGIWAGVAIIIWQFQETTRRALMAHSHFRAACAGDAVSSIGQTALIALLCYWQMLDLTRCFQAIALTSAIAGVMQMWQLHLGHTPGSNILAFGRECWNTGRWVMFGNLTNLFSGTLFNWNFAYWAGLEMLGVYSAIVNLIRPAHPLAFAISTLITPRAAKTRATRGLARAKIVALRFSLVGACMLAPYLGFLILAPRLAIGLAYDWESGHMEYNFMLQLAAITVGFAYVAIAAGTFLNAVERPRQAFYGQIAYTGGFLLIAMPLTALFSLEGAIWGRLAAAVLCAVVTLYFSFTAIDAAPHPQSSTACEQPELQPSNP